MTDLFMLYSDKGVVPISGSGEEVGLHTIRVEPGETYTPSFWYLCPDAADGDELFYWEKLGAADGSAIVGEMHTADCTEAKHDWKRYSWTFTVPSDGDITQAALFVKGRGGSIDLQPNEGWSGIVAPPYLVIGLYGCGSAWDYYGNIGWATSYELPGVTGTLTLERISGTPRQIGPVSVSCDPNPVNYGGTTGGSAMWGGNLTPGDWQGTLHVNNWEPYVVSDVAEFVGGDIPVSLVIPNSYQRQYMLEYQIPNYVKYNLHVYDYWSGVPDYSVDVYANFTTDQISWTRPQLICSLTVFSANPDTGPMTGNPGCLGLLIPPSGYENGMANVWATGIRDGQTHTMAFGDWVNFYNGFGHCFLACDYRNG